MCGIIIKNLTEMIFTSLARKITIILTVAAELVCCLMLNTAGGAALLQQQGYEKCGYALFISSGFLVAALVFGIFRKTLIPIILNLLGTCFYCYTLAVISGIPNTLIPKESTERLLMYHFPTVSVSVLLFMLAFFNFMCPEAVLKHEERKKSRLKEKNRKLAENERIL